MTDARREAERTSPDDVAPTSDFLDALSLKMSAHADEREFADAVARVVRRASEIVEEAHGIQFKHEDLERVHEDLERAPIVHHYYRYYGNRAVERFRQTPAFDKVISRGPIPVDLQWSYPASDVEASDRPYGQPVELAVPVLEPKPSPALGGATWSVQRRGTVVALLVLIGATGLLLSSVAWGLFGIYLGFAAFCFANFAASEVGEENVVLPPDIAILGTVGSLGLAITALIGAL